MSVPVVASFLQGFSQYYRSRSEGNKIKQVACVAIVRSEYGSAFQRRKDPTRNFLLAVLLLKQKHSCNKALLRARFCQLRSLTNKSPSLIKF